MSTPRFEKRAAPSFVPPIFLVVARLLFAKMRKDFFTKEPRLLQPVVAPQLQHDVRATRGTVLFQFFDALRRRSRNRADLVENGVRRRARRGLPASLLHGFRDGTNLFKGEAGAFEQRVR